ncbi:hypothetical protein SOVF_189590, partial [Spinacia oleracea]
YPRVKVRTLEEDDEYDRSRSPLQGFNSLSIGVSTSPVKQSSSTLSVAKVPRSYIPRSITPPPSLSKHTKKAESEDNGIKPHIRASSIPRPRAVISSPDNDQILGCKNEMRFQRPAMKTHVLGQRRKSEEWCTRTITKSALKNHNLAHSKHSEGSCTRTSTSSTLKTHDLAHIRQSEGRCTRTSTTSKKPLKRGECNCNCNCKEMTHASDVKAEKGSAIHVRVPITNITKAKPCFMIT